MDGKPRPADMGRWIENAAEPGLCTGVGGRARSAGVGAKPGRLPQPTHPPHRAAKPRLGRRHLGARDGTSIERGPGPSAGDRQPRRCRWPDGRRCRCQSPARWIHRVAGRIRMDHHCAAHLQKSHLRRHPRLCAGVFVCHWPKPVGGEPKLADSQLARLGGLDENPATAKPHGLGWLGVGQPLCRLVAHHHDRYQRHPCALQRRGAIGVVCHHR